MSVEQGWPGLAQYTPAVPADWTPLPRTVQDALDQLGGRAPGLSTESSFVYRPGGVSAPGVYVTSAQLLAAVDAEDTASNKVVSVDNSLAAAHIGSGPWPDNITWQSGGGAALALLIIDAGATFGGKTYRWRNIDVENAAPGPVMTVALGTAASLNFEASGLVPAGAGNVFADVAGTMQLHASLSELGDGVAGHELFAVEATGTIEGEFVNGSILLPNTIKQGIGPGGSVVLLCDGASQANGVSATQVPVPTIVVFDPLPTFVFQPGGTAGGNVYTTSDSLRARVAQTPGRRIITVDTTFGAAHLTGTWDMDNVRFTGLSGTVLNVDAGSIWNAPSGWAVEQITITGAPAAPIYTPGATAIVQVLIGATLESSTATAFCEDTAGNLEFIVDQSSTLGDGTHPVVTTDVAQTSVVQCFNFSQIKAHALAGLGRTISHIDASSTIGAAQDVTTNSVFFVDQAAQVSYTPGTAGNWNPVPTLANAALDQLAAPNQVVAATNTGTGTATVTAGPTGNLTKAKSGKVLVIATLTGESTGPGTITGQLVRDAGTNIGSTAAVTALSVNDALSMTLLFVDTAPDNAAHTYKATFTAGAGNITAAATSAQIVAVEL